jgi:putative membrane protein
MKLIPKYFFAYKALNSLFLGLSIGSIFTIYAPLKPEVYSVGGVILALGTLLIANLYSKILNLEWFFRISLFVEFVLFAMLIMFLFFPYNYMLALLMYAGYQILFTFGSYLVRSETIFLNETELLTKLDSFKQIGYIVGMGISYLFYKSIDSKNNFEQVYELHYILLIVQIFIIYFVFKSFKKMR